ncbi:MAG: BMP family protein [Gemmatimonadaceae bacterium]
MAVRLSVEWTPRSGRRTLSTLVHTALLTTALACAQEQARTPKERASHDEFRVALLTPGSISDQSWNSGAYNGLTRIRDSLGAQISHIQTRTPADFEENFRQYGAKGFDLVFGHGFEFQDAADRVGPEFPRTIYITTSGNRVSRNVAPMVFGFEDASYLAGMLAGALTQSGVIGTIGGTELPPVKSSFIAFQAGARALNPSVRILSSYVGNWDDASAGKEQALAQIRRGADFIFQNADAAGLGIFQAARESKRVYVFGTNSNQNDVAPDVVIASAVIDIPHAFLAVAREVRDGRFTARVITLGARSEVVKLVINPRLATVIPPALRARMDSVQRLLDAGTFTPPRLEFVDTTAAKPAAARGAAR